MAGRLIDLRSMLSVAVFVRVPGVAQVATALSLPLFLEPICLTPLSINTQCAIACLLSNHLTTVSQ